MKQPRYFVEPSTEEPAILARVRIPDIAERIGPTNPHWTTVVSLLKFVHGSDGIPITRAKAEVVAKGWGAELPVDDPPPPEGEPMYVETGHLM